MKAEHEGLTYLARLTAGLHRYDRRKALPTLDQLLGRTPEQDESRGRFALLNELRRLKKKGLPVRIRKVSRKCRE